MRHLTTLFRLGLLLTAGLFAACTAGDTEPAAAQELVIEGWVAEGQAPIVFVTTTLPLRRQTTPMDSLDSYVAQWARVQVDDGQQTVVLTGMRDGRYFPPYLFTTSRLHGQAGRTYHLTVDWRGLHAEATTTIPATVPIDSLWTLPTAHGDTLRDVCLRFRDDPLTRDHYLIFARRRSEPLNPQLCIFGLLDDKVLAADGTALPTATDGTDLTFHVRRGGLLGEHDYTSFYACGDTVCVSLAHVDSTTFAFWRAYEDNRQLTATPFAPAITPLRGNIRGGHGIWYGCGTDNRWLIIE